MEFIESNLVLINCYCEFDGCETHKENWLTPVHGVIIAYLLVYTSSGYANSWPLVL